MISVRCVLWITHAWLFPGRSGYCAPEVVRGRADNRSDIYSIGAMLFQAVVITEEIADGKYRDFYYQRIGQLVRHSALFLNSETNSDEALMSRICRILEKCLARDPRKRYQSCSELREDLAKARKRLERLLCAPVGSGRDGVTDPTIVIQKLLYEHPLYEAVAEGGKGDPCTGDRRRNLQPALFWISGLQSGQMDGVSLLVAAFSDEPGGGAGKLSPFPPGDGGICQCEWFAERAGGDCLCEAGVSKTFSASAAGKDGIMSSWIWGEDAACYSGGKTVREGNGAAETGRLSGLLRDPGCGDRNGRRRGGRSVSGSGV